MQTSHSIFLSLALLMLTQHATALEAAIALGHGKQFGESYDNSGGAFEVYFHTFERKPTQQLRLGASITYLETESNLNSDTLWAFSLFPELRLQTARYQRNVFFQARALGPTWLSETKFGNREQGMHFSFVALLGLGMYLDPTQAHALSLQYRHFSNASIKKPNDGIDLPISLSYEFAF